MQTCANKKIVCRLCANELFESPLLHFENMPKSAQYLPNNQTVLNDRGIPLDIYQCSGCGLVQLTIEPVPYYKEVIRATAFSESMIQFRKNQFDTFLNRFDLNQAGKKIIEIGCGNGEFLKLLMQFELDVYGIEWSDTSVNECIHNSLNVAKAFIGSANDIISGGPFDSFLMMSFLEHLPAPNATLRGIYNNLSDHAVGIVEVPNYDMILQKNLFSEFIPDHLSYFTRKTICLALEINGFDILACDTIWHDYIVSVVVRKRTSQALHAFIEERNRLTKDLHSFIERFPKRRVSIWGAGHQSFAVIALTGIADHIRYIVDSAPFKQGKFSPATHLPIVSPDYLVQDPVDAVIVLAGSYSDEVVGILRNHYPCNNIAVATAKGLSIVQ
jgi:SAM-dependent methyltransferase